MFACMNDVAEEVIRIWGYNDGRSPSRITSGGRYTRASTARGRHMSVPLSRDECCSARLGCWRDLRRSRSSAPKFYDKVGLPEDTRTEPFGESSVIRSARTRAVMRTVLLIPSMLDVLCLEPEREESRGRYRAA